MNMLNIRNNWTQRRQDGFTLIEVMVVVVILAILAAIIVPRILSRPGQAKLVAAQQDISQIQSAMDLYKLDNGFYPSTSQGIQALVTKPSGDPVPQNWASNGYLHTMPKDPWGYAFHYAHPGTHGAIDIWSDGPPGKNHKLGNWDENQ